MPLADDGLGDLTYRIIGAYMAVHNDLGPGHREVVYQRALELKFQEMRVNFESQVELGVANEHGETLIIYKPDFRIERCVWLEIKALSHLLTADEEAQVIDYFAADIEQTCSVALLVNFGRPRLEYKRLFPPRKLAERTRKHWGKSTNVNE
jgi:GxxExxY protein